MPNRNSTKPRTTPPPKKGGNHGPTVSDLLGRNKLEAATTCFLRDKYVPTEHDVELLVPALVADGFTRHKTVLDRIKLRALQNRLIEADAFDKLVATARGDTLTGTIPDELASEVHAD